MLPLFKFENLAPEALAPPAGGAKTVEDIYEALKSGDDVIDLEDKKEKVEDKEDEPEKKAKDEDVEEDIKDEEDEEDEVKIEDELEEELSEPSEEDLELSTPVSRREILKKYPKLFKEFPYLQKAYYREQQFTKMFATPDEAREVVEKAETLSKFEKDLSDGNTEIVLKAIKADSPKAFAKAVDGYMEALANVDEKASQHVIGNILKETIRSMVLEARASDNDALHNAAVLLNQFVFASSKYEPPKRLSVDEKPEVNDKQRQLEERENTFNKRRLEANTSEMTDKLNKSFKNTIEANIDPKDSMTPYVKKTAIREATEELESLISKDSRFNMLVDRLWEKAIKSDFEPSDMKKIRDAFISKARTLLPSVIKKARNEALRGLGKRVRDDSNEREDKENPVRKSRKANDNDDDRRPARDLSSKAKEIPRNLSTLEKMNWLDSH